MNTWSNKTKSKSAITILAALTLGLMVAMGGPLKEGSSFPDLTRCGLEGKLPDLHGKVVLVDFFASWCEPCKESFPVMEELYQKYGSKGLVIVAVNLDAKKENMEEFLKKHPANFTIVRDASNKLVGQVKIPTMPSSFLLDHEGKVYAFHRGFKGEETRKQYTTEIESLLK
jgi:thiol-disulfide isomerase/thioredoxin